METRQEPRAQTSGETHTGTVSVLMGLGILCAVGGGIWIDGEGSVANFVAHSASIFTIFGFAATLVQLRSIRYIRQEKQAILQQERHHQAQTSFRERFSEAEWSIDKLRRYLAERNIPAAALLSEMALKNYTNLMGSALLKENTAIRKRIRIITLEIRSIHTQMYAKTEKENGAINGEEAKTNEKKITYIKSENEYLRSEIRSWDSHASI